MQHVVIREETVGAPTLFDDRYGVGAYRRLLDQLQQPCISFAAIAGQFGVSRERVRQWHTLYLPDAPSGLQRRRLCQLQRARRQVLGDELFQAFYRQARAVFAPDEVAVIRTRSGLRKRAALVRGRLIVLKKARLRHDARDTGRNVYVLSPCRRPADFVYYQLGSQGFLLLPLRELPRSGTTYQAADASKYSRFRGTFAALTGNGDAAASQD